jgi:hypothetical protein
MLLDDVLPDYCARERHERVVALDPAAAVATALAARPDALSRMLFRLRGLPRAGSFEQLFRRMGFQELGRARAKVIFGSSGRPWRPSGGMGPFHEAAPGTVRVALSLEAKPLGPGRSRLATETRVQPVDDLGRRAFHRYWLVVAPFSALTRRRWLGSIK